MTNDSFEDWWKNYDGDTPGLAFSEREKMIAKAAWNEAMRHITRTNLKVVNKIDESIKRRIIKERLEKVELHPKTVKALSVGFLLSAEMSGIRIEQKEVNE